MATEENPMSSDNLNRQIADLKAKRAALRAARSQRKQEAAPVTDGPPAPASGYTEVSSSVFGPGRRYRAQPGATQYDSDGTGRFTTQIWDNS